MQPVLIVRRRPHAGPPANGLRPVMAVETVQRNAAPLQNSERGTVDLFGMHDHRGTELHLADLPESYRLCKTREEQGRRVGTAEISGSDSWNQEKEHDS